MRVEHLKEWLSGILTEEKGEGRQGAGESWHTFVELVQIIWETGSIPQQMTWMVVVLIPRGTSGDYRGIGLLDPIWKVMEILMDNQLKTLALHDCLHGFPAGRGTGTAIMEVKLAQQLVYLKQVPLYGLFIDLRKAFNAMDRKRCLQILEDCGVGPKIRRLIQTFWRLALLVCKAWGCYGRPFLAGRGVTQGRRLTPR